MGRLIAIIAPIVIILVLGIGGCPAPASTCLPSRCRKSR